MEWPQLRQPESKHLVDNAPVIGSWIQRHWKTAPAVPATDVVLPRARSVSEIWRFLPQQLRKTPAIRKKVEDWIRLYLKAGEIERLVSACWPSPAQRPVPAPVNVPSAMLTSAVEFEVPSDSEFGEYEEEVYGTWQEQVSKAAAARTPEQLAETAETPQGRQYWSRVVKWQREAPQEIERIKASGVQEDTMEWGEQLCALWRSIFGVGA